MSEEVAMAIADAPTIAQQAEQIAHLDRRLRRTARWAIFWRQAAKRNRAGWHDAFETSQDAAARHQLRRQALEGQRDALRAEIAQLGQRLRAAAERERIAAEAYNGQQSSQRELETLYQDALRRLAEMQTLQAGAAVLRNALQWYADRVYSHTMGLPPEVQWIAEDALKRTTAGVEPADANPTRAQLLGAQSALRNAMEQAEASKRLIAGMLGQAPAEPADDDGHGKPYLNEM